MTLYLTDNTPADEIRRAVESGFVKAVKLYPAGATTNSDAGVTDLAKCDAVLAEMEKAGMPLLMHGEVTDPAIDIFDRENIFIDTVLQPLLARRPGLRVVFEHITTKAVITSYSIHYTKLYEPASSSNAAVHHLQEGHCGCKAGDAR